MIDSKHTNNFTYTAQAECYQSAPCPVVKALGSVENERNAKEGEQDCVGRERRSIAVEGFRDGAVGSHA